MKFKQWQLKNNSIVELIDGRKIKFIKMDGAYAHWDLEGRLKIGNYEEFEETDFGYKVTKQ